MKPEKPITRKEMYLDVATGGSTELPSPATLEEIYLAKIAGMTVDLPAPAPLKHKFLAKIAGMQIDVPTYTTDLPRIYAYLAKAAGQDVEIPQPVTREEMYWFDYCGGTPTPPEREYTGAVPVTFVADGTPLIDYLISGNTVQSGTPTPDNPITPQGTGERTGNLFDGSISATNKRIAISTGGTYNSNGYSVSEYIPIQPSTPYIVNTSYNSYYALYDENKNYIFGEDTKETKPTKATYSNAAFIKFDFKSADISTIMLNTGSTPLPYEPYGYKIPISSANTTTPVYLGEVETTRQIKKLVLTGSDDENWSSTTIGTNDYIYRMELSNLPESGVAPICTHYTGSTATRWVNIANYEVTTSIVNSVAIRHSGLTGVSDWKTYLAQQYANGTPVTVWYVLAEPETAVVNEPLMKIGDYADTVSMEQAGVQIPTANGSTTLDVETTVRPSEVYIKYKGV